MSKRRNFRVLIALLVAAAGIILMLAAMANLFATVQALKLAESIGEALLVSGIVSVFHETVLRRLEAEETADELGRHVAQHVCNTLEQRGTGTTGIRVVSKVRRGWEGFYTWALSNKPSEMFFAGRSVLHRMDDDFRRREMGSVEDVLVRRLKSGAKIRIMILNPCSDLIPRLATEEGQTTTAMLNDVATSVGICARLNQALEDDFPPTSRLDIRLYDEVPYFSFHKVGDECVVGFYFQTAVGHSSAAYEVVDEATQGFFGGHFEKLFDRSEGGKLLTLSSDHRTKFWNLPLYERITNELREKLGTTEAEQHLAGTYVRRSSAPPSKRTKADSSTERR